MSDDDAEIIPPKKGLPATRTEKPPSPVGDVRRTDTGGVVRTALTGWQAKGQSRALDRIAERTRSESDLIKAQGELADEYESTARKINRLRKLPQTLALDDAKFNAEQESEYHAINENRDEREHKSQLDKRRRLREIEDAEAAIVEAQRRKFTSEQGYENQKRLKERNLKIWETRKDAVRLDAEVKTAKLREQVGPEEETTSATEDFRAKAEKALLEALADGNEDETDRWQRVLDALEEK